MQNNKIFILLGGSGVGKTWLGTQMKELGVPEIVSHTTRGKRIGEVEGVTYYFINKEDYDTIDKVEHTEYPKDSGIFYCLSRQEIETKLNNHGHIFAICDLNGVKQLKEQYPNQVEVIYLHVPLEEMENRMRLRGDSEEKISERLWQVKATDELSNYMYADHIIENVNMERTIQRLNEIIALPKDSVKVKRTFLLNEPSVLAGLPAEVIESYRTLKTRHYKLLGNQVAEIDVFHESGEDAIVKVAFLSEDEANAFDTPDWFGVEVTHEPLFV